MSPTKSPTPSQTSEPLVDGLTLLGYAIGYALIAVGLWFAILALTS